MKTTEAIMEILTAYDLTHSYRDAAALVGCAPNTVVRYVLARDAGGLKTAPAQRNLLIDPFREKVEEWVDVSHGRIRADVAQRKLEAMGYDGSERTTRRAVAEAKAVYRAGHRRRFRPWLPEPGLWFQWDYGDGPLVEERRSWWWCAWLAWSKHRVVLPIRDKPLPTVIACIDVTLAPVWGRTNVWFERQREDADAGSHRAPSAPPDDGRGGPSLWPDAGQLCARGPPLEGWFGSHRAHRLGGPGTDRSQPAAQLFELRRATPCVRRRV